MTYVAEYYRKRHRDGPYGVTGHKKAKDILAHLGGDRLETALDWGAGSRTLASALISQTDWTVYSYDPYIPSLSNHPLPGYDAVVTTDVLEHLPYEEIDAAIEEGRR